MKYGIIGSGYSFRAHTCTLSLIPEAEIVAVADMNKERLDAALKLIGDGNVKKYQDYNDLLADDNVELVIVATPNFTHAEIAGAALKAGKKVLCEKPMATTVEDCEKLLKLEKESGSRLFVGLECRYNYFYREIGRIIESGQIGRVNYIWCKEYRGFFQSGSEDWRKSQKTTGGALLEKNVHHFDLLNWYAGSSPKWISGIGGNAFNKDAAVNDETMVIMEYGNGVKVNLNVCLYAPWTSHSGSHQEFGFVGDKGMMEAFLDTRRLYITDTATGSVSDIHLAVPKIIERYKDVKGYRPDYDSWFYLLYEEHNAILSYLKTGEGFVIDGHAGLESAKAALAAEKAVQERRIMTL